jgi:tetratricopeptide (TPR) repeat protein
VTSYSRPDVLRILQISYRQLHGWERAGLIPQQQIYSFQDLGQLRTLRALREEDVPAASIRHSIVAMKAVSGMANPLLEACLVRTGTTRLAFRYSGAIVDPIRRQLLFDFERLDRMERTNQMDQMEQMDGTHASARHRSGGFEPSPLRRAGLATPRGVQDRFLAAVQAEEAGEKPRATALYEEILSIDPNYAAAYINLGTILFHQRNFVQAEELYRRATVVDPSYVLAFFDLGNVLDELQRLDESIEAYRRAVALSPRYADAHYNLALAYERKNERRKALSHWQSYVRLDRSGPWSEHARNQIRKLLSQEKLSIAGRATGFVAPAKGMAALQLVASAAVSLRG